MYLQSFELTGPWVIFLIILLLSVTSTDEVDSGSLGRSLGPRALSSRITGEVCDGHQPENSMTEAVMYFIRQLDPTKLHVAFEDHADQCLVEALWQASTPAQLLTGQQFWLTIQRSTYTLAQQYVVIGSLPWIISTIQAAKEEYALENVNAMRTKWLWIVKESPNESFEDVIHKVVLKEGIRGFLIHISKRMDETQVLSNWSIQIGSVEDDGTGSWKLSPAGKWKQGGKIEIDKPLWPQPPTNFGGRIVKMSIVKKPTVFEFEEGQMPSEAQGYATDLLREVQRQLNFSLSIHLTKGFGSMKSNGSWNGMVGVLSRGEADLAPLDFTPVYSRTLVIDFGIIYSTDNVVIISKAPSEFIKPFILLQIFTPFVWACFLGIGLIVGSVISGLLKMGDKIYYRNEEEEHLSKSEWNLFLHCTLALKILVYQSSPNWPSKSGTRQVSGTMMVLAVIFGSLYSGSITAFLAIPFRSEPVNSLEDLIATDIQPAFRGGASTYNYFVIQTEGVLGEVKKRMISFAASHVGTWTFFSDIADGKYALIDTSSSALGISGKYEQVGSSCLFHVAREPVRLDLDAFAFRKNSPFIHQFDEIMRWLRSYGIIEYMKGHYYSKNCDAVIASDKPKPLNVTQAQGAFYVFSVGLCISLGTFLLEVLAHNVGVFHT